MKKVVVLMEVPNDYTEGGIQFSVQEAFGSDVSVHEVSEYPFESTCIQAHYLDIFRDAESQLNDEHQLTFEQLVNVAVKVGQEESDDAEERSNRIFAAAREFGYIPDEDQE